MLVAARTAASQQSNVQDVPAPAKQSLSAAETSVRVTRARALQAVVVPALCSGRASSPATDVTSARLPGSGPGASGVCELDVQRAGLWSGSLLPQQGSFGAAQGHPGRTRAETSHGMGRGLRLLPDVALEALVSNGVLPTGCGDGSVSTGCPVPGILLSSHCLLLPWLVMHNPRNMHRKCRPAREAISLKLPRDEPTVSPVPAGGARRAGLCRP